MCFSITRECGGTVYTADLKSAAARLAGSNPASRTKDHSKEPNDTDKNFQTDKAHQDPLGHHVFPERSCSRGIQAHDDSGATSKRGARQGRGS